MLYKYGLRWIDKSAGPLPEEKFVIATRFPAGLYISIVFFSEPLEEGEVPGYEFDYLGEVKEGDQYYEWSKRGTYRPH